MSKFLAAAAALLAASLLMGAAHAGNYLDDLARLDAQIAIQRKQIEARDLAVQAAGRVSLPTVRYISGFEDDLSAVVGYGNGRKVTVKRGDQLPGGVEVKSVRQNGVLVHVGKQVELLEFTTPEDSVPGAQTREQAAPLMPPLPQVNVALPGSVALTPSATQQAALQPAPVQAKVVQPTPAAAASPAPQATHQQSAQLPTRTNAAAGTPSQAQAPVAASVAASVAEPVQRPRTALAIGHSGSKND